MPTYCCSRSTRVSFRCLPVGLETPSVRRPLGTGRREEPWRSTTDLATNGPLTAGVRTPPHRNPVTQKPRCASSWHQLGDARFLRATVEAWVLTFPGGSGGDQPPEPVIGPSSR